MTLDKTIAAVLFDLDGTLIDTAPDFATVLNQMLTDRAMPALSFAQIRQQVSNGARAMVTLGFGEPGQNGNFDALLAEFLERYETHLAVDSRLFDGLELSLGRLEERGIPWGIVTNKPSRYAVPLLKGLELDQRCGVLVCPDHVSNKKPDPESLLLAAKTLKADPRSSLYVGDHQRDIEAGLRAGNYTISAAWGYIDQNDDPAKWGAALTCTTPEDFDRWLQTHLDENK